MSSRPSEREPPKPSSSFSTHGPVAFCDWVLSGVANVQRSMPASSRSSRYQSMCALLIRSFVRGRPNVVTAMRSRVARCGISCSLSLLDAGLEARLGLGVVSTSCFELPTVGELVFARCAQFDSLIGIFCESASSRRDVDHWEVGDLRAGVDSLANRTMD